MTNYTQYIKLNKDLIIQNTGNSTLTISKVSSNNNQPAMLKKTIKIKPREIIKEVEDESWFDYLNIFD